MATSLAIIYSANLQADFVAMSRVATVIHGIRQQYGAAPYPLLLLDIGRAWSKDVWVSAITEHRAPYLVLDAMAYHIIHADGLDLGGILGLQEVMQAQLMDHTIVKHWRWRDMVVHVGPRSTAPGIRWSWDAATDTADGVAWYESANGQLTLLPINGVGHLEVSYPTMTVQKAQRYNITPDIRPDPTIVATTEYVTREARFYESKQKGNNVD